MRALRPLPRQDANEVVIGRGDEEMRTPIFFAAMLVIGCEAKLDFHSKPSEQESFVLITNGWLIAKEMEWSSKYGPSSVLDHHKEETNESNVDTRKTMSISVCAIGIPVRD